MLEKIIKFQNDSEREFKSSKNFKTLINYIIAFTFFIMSTIIAGITFPIRYTYKKIFTKANNSKILELNEKNFETVLNKEKLILIDFWAEWCGPCVMMSSIIEKFASESKNIKVAKVNADLNKEIVEKHQIRGLPQFVLIENGVEIKRFAGAMTKNDLKNFCYKD